ncbi:MAG TPA: ABC transporter substrate-binding protein [Clostridia bacterium]|nr:ABC transporter substrate-binding protein [Clostridia bacterium]
MKKKNLCLALGVFMLMTVLFSGCSNPASSATSSSPASEVVKVGFMGPLTGDSSVYGESSLNAVNMYFEKVNKNGGLLGKQVQIVSYDTKGDSTEAVNVVKRLTGQDKVIGIIGPNGSGQAIPISSVLEEMKIPDISEIATNPKVTVLDGKIKPFNFRACFIDPYQGSVAAGFAVDVLKSKKAAILYDIGDDYSTGLTQFFEETYKAKGGEIVAKEAWKTGEVDFRAQLTKIKATQPDVIFMPYLFKEVSLSARQARELGITATFLGSDTWPSEQLLTMGGDAIENSYFVNHLDMEDPSVKSFVDEYKAKFGKAPEITGFLATDASAMLEDAVKRANSFDGVKIKDALETTNISGITGNIKIGKDTHNPEGKEAAIIKITGGKFVFQQKYTPQ